MVTSRESTSDVSHDNFRLRAISTSDRGGIQSFLDDRELQHLLIAYPPEQGAADADRWIERRTPGSDIVAFTIADANDRFCGFVQISGWHRRGKFGWLGMALSSHCRSQGLGHWALNGIIEYGAQKMGLEKILLEVRADNIPAVSLYSKHDFRTVGSMRDHYFDGVKKYDVIIMERKIGRTSE